MRFTVVFTDSALQDLRFFKKYEQTLMVDQTQMQLSHQPAVETSKRKSLEPNSLAEWELRIGVYRVFYDIDPTTATVTVRAVGYKDHNKLFIRGKEYSL